jgi:8-oxo-dGTP pyrophosphatase MutT (NUDIX family)
VIRIIFPRKEIISLGLLDVTKPTVLKLQSLVGRVRRGITFGVRGLVLDGDGVLLVKHSYLPGWYLPGGAVEAGETALESLRRELVEEANIEMTGPAELMGLYFNREMSGRDHVALYRVSAFRQTAPWKANHEILAAEFFPLAALPDDATKATRRRIAEHLSADPPGSDW